MFACLYVPPSAAMRNVPSSAGGTPDATRGFITRSRGAAEPLHAGDETVTSVLLDIARMVSPRVAARSRYQIVIDVEGLERLVGDPRAIGERLRQAAEDRGIAPVHVAVAGTCTAAMLLAAARAGVSVVPAGGEADALAPLPLRTLAVLASEGIEVRRQKTEDRRQNSTPEPRIPNPESRELAPGAQRLAPSPESRLPRRSPEESGRAKAGIPSPDSLAVVARWGLRTLGELAALPAAELSERLGQDGVRWQRLARGEDSGPLMPALVEEPFEASLELEWPIDGLEPLSFVLSRLLDPLCQRLEYRDRGAAVLHLRLRLVTRALHIRSLQLPAPMRDPKVLRTLLLLDLESHPAPAGIDAVTVAIDPTPGRIVQESLLTRAMPAPELISTLVARLQALMGDGRCGSPALVDSHRPGAFSMRPFVVHQDEGRRQKSEDRRQNQEARSQKPEAVASSQYSVASTRNPEPRIPSPGELAPSAKSRAPSVCLRRFRLPIPARVLMDGTRPISVRTDRLALAGGRVQAAAGPWRTSGEWWKTPAAPAGAQPASPPRRAGWNRDEWDVALSDGGLYRIFEDRDTGRWFVGAVVD
jgi:protein ImuB